MEKKKINLFQDKEYGELDYLSRLVEPFIFPLNDVIAQIPERVDFTYEDVVEFVGKHHSMSFDKGFLFQIVAERNGIIYQEEDKREISDYLYVEIPGPIIDVQVDFAAEEMSGTFSLIKRKPQLDDEDIKKYISEKVGRAIHNIDREKAEFSRLNEIMELINCTEHRSSRSARYKIRSISLHMGTIIEEDRWRVRNADLMIKTGTWIKSYIEHGNLAALSNFTRLKCMTHKGNAIYSMEETI